MPISLILATQGPLMRRQASRIALAFAVIGEAASRRLGALEAIARQVRAWPVWAFQGRALEVTIHPSQRGALRAYESVGQAFAAPFVAFGRGVAGFVQDIRDDLALPRLLGQVQGLLDDILAAIDRVERAGPRLFDIGSARFSDIFGIAALVTRSLNGSWGFVGRVLADAQNALSGDQPVRGGAATPPATDAAGPGPIGRSFAEQLSDAGRWLTGGLIALPLLPGLIGTLVQSAWLQARGMILNVLTMVETRVHDLRRAVLEWVFNRLPGLLAPVPILTAVASAMVVEYVKFWINFAERYMTALFAELRIFFTQIAAFFNAWITAINAVAGVLSDMMNFDILRFVLDKAGLLPLFRLLRISPPSLTLGDILDASGTVARVATGVVLRGLVGKARSLVPTSIFPGAGRKLLALENLIAALFQAPRPYPDELAGPPPRIAAMPNVYDTIVGRAGTALVRSVRQWGDRTAAGVDDVFQGLGRAFDVYAIDMARLSAASARVVPAARIGRFSAEAQGLSADLFGDQLAHLRRVTATARRPSGSGFQQWLTTGGFNVIGAAIPPYVAEMRRFWQSEREGAGDAIVDLGTAVSPHILARRARLARVQMRRLTIDAGNRPLDPALAREIAERFRGAVGDAYRDGARAMRVAAAG